VLKFVLIIYIVFDQFVINFCRTCVEILIIEFYIYHRGDDLYDDY